MELAERTPSLKQSAAPMLASFTCKAALTQPKRSNQADILDFWWPVSSSFTSFYLVGKHKYYSLLLPMTDNLS